MTENTGRPYEIRSMSRSGGRIMSQIMNLIMSRIAVIRNIARIIRPKFEKGNPGAGRGE